MNLICPECHEHVLKLAKPLNKPQWPHVDPKRLEHAHLDGEPLCPVMVGRGYQPAMPVEETENEEE